MEIFAYYGVLLAHRMVGRFAWKRCQVPVNLLLQKEVEIEIVAYEALFVEDQVMVGFTVPDSLLLFSSRIRRNCTAFHFHRSLCYFQSYAPPL